MSVSYMIFNGINSLDVKGITLSTMPTPSTPSRRVVRTSIAGRNGDLRILENDITGQDVYDSMEKTVKMFYYGTDYDLIKRWLRGTDKLILSNQPDRYFKASIDNIIPFERLIQQKAVHAFTIAFSYYPYAFLTSGDKPIIYNPTITTWETVLMNDYDVSLPHLRIYARGDIGMTVNGVETDFYSVDGYIEIDSDLQQCYKGAQNLGMNMSGDYPVLVQGENIIQFTGNIQQLVLTPKWRIL